MRFLIKWKDNGEQAIQTFGLLPEGKSGEELPNDEQIFYWLTPTEWQEIGEGYDGGEWEVIACACDECLTFTQEGEGKE